jgi:NifU-like protein involved in Fe-S cluster formation
MVTGYKNVFDKKRLTALTKEQLIEILNLTKEVIEEKTNNENNEEDKNLDYFFKFAIEKFNQKMKHSTLSLYMFKKALSQNEDVEVKQLSEELMKSVKVNAIE